MATRTYVSTKGDTWEWEETSLTVKLLEMYWQTVESNRKKNETV